MSIVTRVCRRCKVEQSTSEFYLESEERLTARHGKKFIRPCRTCTREVGFERRKPRLDYAYAVKAESGCVDCGLHPDVLEVLEFDHRPDCDKVTDVSNLYSTGTFDAFKAEIAKCEVVCANCHRVRTVKRRLAQPVGPREVRRRPLQEAKDRANGLGAIWDRQLAGMVGPDADPTEVMLF